MDDYRITALFNIPAESAADARRKVLEFIAREGGGSKSMKQIVRAHRASEVLHYSEEPKGPALPGESNPGMPISDSRTALEEFLNKGRPESDET